MTALPLPVFRESARSAALLLQLDCNARCPFCSTRVYTEEGVLSPVDFRQGLVRRAKEYTLSLDELKRHYDALRAEGVEKVSLQGGEPTLHEGLLELVRYGRTLGFREQSLVTNGRQLKDPAFTRALVRSGLDTIVLSIFGDGPELHDASMGVRGAYDDLAAGVDLLVAEQRAGAPVTVMAQLTLHADNFLALPSTVRHWYGRGLRDFSLRLLRETDNTRRDAPGRWFFDLARLRAPMAEALRFCRDRPDAIVTLGEIFHCAVPPDLLGFVLRDLGANPGLLGHKRQVTRHFEASTGDARDRAGGADGPCATCDLHGMCVRLEPAYRPLFTGEVVPWDVARTVHALAEGPVGADQRDEVLHLLGVEERLAWFGVPDADRLALRARAGAAQADDPDGRARTLLGDRGRKELLDRLRKNGRPVAVRLVPLTELGVRGPLDGEPSALLDRLEVAAPPDRRAALAFVRKAGVLANGPLVLLVVYVRRGPGPEQLVVTALFDDAHLEAALLAGVLAGLVEATSPRA